MKSNTKKKSVVPTVLIWIVAILLVWLIGNSIFVSWQVSKKSTADSVAHENNQLASVDSVSTSTLAAIFSVGPYIQIGSNGITGGFGIGQIEDPSSKKYPITITYNVPYGPDPAEVADVCLPDTSYTNATAVILIHGGGWIDGSPAKLDAACKKIASRGMVAISLGYRLASTTSAVNSWPAQLQDVQLATRWLRANADTYHLDPTKVCSWGESAGAHLAVFLGVQKTIAPGDRANLYKAQSPAVSCVIDNFGPVNLTSEVGTAESSVVTMLGNVSNLKHAEKDASPLFLVTASSAPTLIVHGDQDTVVKPIQSRWLFSALRDSGVPTHLEIYSGTHGFGGLTKEEQATYDDMSIAFIERYAGTVR